MNRERYLRQLNLSEIGETGQKKLAASSVLIVGMGGLGSPAALYLAAAGVGTLGLVDGDSVSLSNLHRQILFHSEDVGSTKVEKARKHLLALNPEIQIQIHPEFLNPENAEPLFRNYDLILDGTDDYESKFLITDAAFHTGKPVVYGSVNQLEGQVALFDGKEHACYRCFQPTFPTSKIRNCAEAGVLGPIAGLVGCFQATLTLQFFLGLKPPTGMLTAFDLAGTWNFSSLQIRKNPDCPTCSGKNSSRNQIQEISSSQLAERIQNGESLLILDVRDEEEWNTGHLANALHWPLDKMEKGEFPKIGSGQNAVVYCRLGSRSRRAIELLSTKTQANFLNLKGGIRAWPFTLLPSGMVGAE